MKKILTVGILVAIFLVSIRLVAAGNMFCTSDIIGENGKKCICLYDEEGNCILDSDGHCICERQCTVEQCSNKNLNGKCCITIDNSNGCCKRN